MAREKKEEEAADTGGWINTFADLMNLLLCFFVLLFSMSTVDADKYEQLVTSMNESINIFDGGGKAMSDGAFLGSGTDQIVSISQYFNEFEESGEEEMEQHDQKTEQDGENKSEGKNDNKPEEEKKNNESKQDENTKKTKAEEEKEYENKKLQQLKERTENLYGDISNKASKSNIQDDITINMDKSYQYVQISLNGAVLFDSGDANIKKDTLKLLSKVGDILKLYDSHMIKIEGHTDNVPISGGEFKNNMWLSSARALAVFEYLKTVKKISPKKLEATGRGSYDSVASNKNEKGRAQNRRVELKIYTDE